jgi:predicted cation transporter
MAIVLTLPFFSKRAEEELESFLFAMGFIAVTISGLWSWKLIWKALHEPIPIAIAVFVSGFIFEHIRDRLTSWIHSIVDRFGIRTVLIIMITVLGLLSSVITAIIAGLILAEITSSFKLSRVARIRIIVTGCFAIGMGAALTPLGEPLATVVFSKLTNGTRPPLTFLIHLLGLWIVPAVAGFGVLAALIVHPHHVEHRIIHHPAESSSQILTRAVKTYIFVVGLVLLGTGISPVVDRYMPGIPGYALYWINIVSAALDNATLTAAEVSASMPPMKMQCMLLGLLISGGILIPGNIPNIICANKLSIKSKEWARLGIPIGLAVMALYFILLLILGC